MTGRMQCILGDPFDFKAVSLFMIVLILHCRGSLMIVAALIAVAASMAVTLLRKTVAAFVIVAVLPHDQFSMIVAASDRGCSHMCIYVCSMI